MKKPYHNDTDKIVHVGTCTIWPGQTREVDETLHPDYKPEPKENDTVDPDADLKAILDGNITEVRDDLSALSDRELDTLESYERKEMGGKDRKGVFEAITETRLKRAASIEQDEFKASLQGLDEETLQEKLGEAGDDPDRKNLVDIALFTLSLQDLDEDALLAKFDEVGGDIARQELIQDAIELLDGNV